MNLQALQIEIFCNGQFEKKEAGYAALLIARENGVEVMRKTVTEYSKEENMNGIRAQLMSAVIGLRALNGSMDVTVINSLDYLAKVMRGEWTSDKNQDIIRWLHYFASRHQVKWLHTKEYTGDLSNMTEIQVAALNALREADL